jgi:hypothetical protein
MAATAPAATKLRVGRLGGREETTNITIHNKKEEHWT